MGCDSKNHQEIEVYCSFNPRTHMGCDINWMDIFVVWFKFQSTHPHGVRLSMILIIDLKNVFQSTHPHGVRRKVIYWVFLFLMFQSTHPHGVRQYIDTISNKLNAVSIHAPTWGATGAYAGKGIGFGVSIHAPTWGATESVAKTDGWSISFNPRTHMGCDPNNQIQKCNVALFQSTHPHGVRLFLEIFDR